MSEKICDDPIYFIRVAVAAALFDLVIDGNHKVITDAVVDRLPDFFRQPLRGCIPEEEAMAAIRKGLKAKGFSVPESDEELFLVMHRILKDIERLR